MNLRALCGSIVMMLLLVLPAHGSGTRALRTYFSHTADKVKATENPSEKRQILAESFETMSSALRVVQQLPLMSADDRAGIARFQAAMQEKQNELEGRNGFVRVSDQQLNAFSTYVVQSMEQADQVISISVVTLLLILILVVLLV